MRCVLGLDSQAGNSATSGIVAEGEKLSPLRGLGVMIRQDVLSSREHSLAAAVAVQRGVAVPAILPCGSAGRARLFIPRAALPITPTSSDGCGAGQAPTSWKNLSLCNKQP